jgi:mannose-6-phosphate isomerase-like protein (cupin superfamily)
MSTSAKRTSPSALCIAEKLDAPLPYSVAEHDQVSEVYHVIDGSGTLVLGPDLIDKKRRPADDKAGDGWRRLPAALGRARESRL